MSDSRLSDCTPFQSPYGWNFYFSVYLAIGIFVSYLPQYVRIIHRKTSEGISPWFLLLGITSGICAVFNIFLLSTPIYDCCAVIVCFAHFLFRPLTFSTVRRKMFRGISRYYPNLRSSHCSFFNVFYFHFFLTEFLFSNFLT